MFSDDAETILWRCGWHP